MTVSVVLMVSVVLSVQDTDTDEDGAMAIMVVPLMTVVIMVDMTVDICEIVDGQDSKVELDVKGTVNMGVTVTVTP